MNQYERKIGQAAIRTFGRIPNIIKAIEELSELQQALCKHIVSETDAMTVASVHQEIADVSIMLNRLMMLFDPTEVQDWRDSKLEHMARLLGLESECDKCARRGPCATCEGAEGPEEPTGEALEEMRL